MAALYFLCCSINCLSVKCTRFDSALGGPLKPDFLNNLKPIPLYAYPNLVTMEEKTCIHLIGLLINQIITLKYFVTALSIPGYYSEESETIHLLVL